MALQFIYGRSHSGKTKYMLDKAIELYNSGKSLIIVVPEQFTHIAEKRLISELGFIGNGKAEVLSFDRMCKRINSNYPNYKKPLTAVGKSLIVSEILSDINLEYYKSAAAQNGFVDICCDEITELKKYMISSEELINASQQISNVALAMKIRDIANIYSAYQSQIETRFSDSDDTLNILASNLELYKPYSGVTFLFDEFSSFTPQEKNIISIISAQADDVFLSFCLDASPCYSGLFKVTLQNSQELALACKERGCRQLTNVKLTESYYENNDLAFLEENIFSDSPAVYDGECKSISISTSENPYSEVINLAQNIVDIVRNHGARYRDISVVCADIDSYGYIIRSVFNTYKIPYFIDEKVRVIDHSIVTFVVNILDVYLSGYSGESVVNFLKSGCITAERGAICNVDNYIAATGATKNTWLSDERFNKSLEFYIEGDLSKKKDVIHIRDKYILSLATLHDQIKGRNTVRFITQKIYDYLLDIGFECKILDYIKLFKKENNICLAKQYEAVWKILIDAFDTMVYILGDKKVNIREYRYYLNTAFGQQKTGIIPTSLDEVIVGDLLRSKSEKVKYQFVVGAIDGAFPNTSEGQPIITDAEKKLLSNMKIKLAPPSSERAYFDRFQIYSVFSHPDKALFVSYPASNSDFSSVRPAFAIRMMQNIFPSVKIDGSLQSKEQSFYSDSAALEFMAESVAAVTRGGAADDSWKDVYKYYTDSGQTDKIERITRLIDSDKKISRLSPELMEKLYGNEFYSTISRIQRYNSCRYSYYLEYMMKLKPRKSFGLEGSDIGTLIHSIIEDIFTDITRSGIELKGIGKEYFDAEVKKLLDEYINQLCDSRGEITERDIFSVMRLKESIVDSLMAVRDHIVNSQFVPLGNEIVFDDNNIGCIELQLENGKKVKITGKIDRADAFTNEQGTFIRVIDYKTGRKSFNFTDVFYGLDVQLLVYMNALVNKVDNAHPAGALYFKILNPVESVVKHPSDIELEENRGFVAPMEGVVSEDKKVLSAFSTDSIKTTNKLSSVQFRVLGDYINSIVADSASAISNGLIDINPHCRSGGGSCDYCNFNSICNFTDGKTGTFRALQPYRNINVFDAISKVMPKKDGGEE